MLKTVKITKFSRHIIRNFTEKAIDGSFKMKHIAHIFITAINK